ELYVEAASSSRGLTLDLLANSPDGVDRVFADIGGENRVAHRFEKCRRHSSAAGGGASSDQGLTLPVLGRGPVVRRRAADVPHQVAVAPVRTKPQVDSVDRAFSGVAADRLYDSLGDSREELLVCYHRGRRARIAGGVARSRIEKEEIYVRSVVQL